MPIFGYPIYLWHSYFRANNKLIYNAYIISFRSRLLMIKLLSIIINGFAVVHLIFILNINLSLPSRLLCITIRELLWLMSYSTDTHTKNWAERKLFLEPSFSHACHQHASNDLYSHLKPIKVGWWVHGKKRYIQTRRRRICVFWLIYEMYLRVICDCNIILALMGSANFICMRNTLKFHQIKHDIEKFVPRLEIVMYGVICHNQFWA